MKWIADPSANAGKSVDQIIKESKDRMLPEEPRSRRWPWVLLGIASAAVLVIVAIWQLGLL